MWQQLYDEVQQLYQKLYDSSWQQLYDEVQQLYEKFYCSGCIDAVYMVSCVAAAI